MTFSLCTFPASPLKCTPVNYTQTHTQTQTRTHTPANTPEGTERVGGGHVWHMSANTMHDAAGAKSIDADEHCVLWIQAQQFSNQPPVHQVLCDAAQRTINQEIKYSKE